MEPVSPLRPGSSTPNIAGLGSLHVPSPDYSLSPSAFKISQSQSPDATISSPTLKLPSGGYGYSGSSFPLNFNSGQELSTEVQRKAAEWERQIESLDAKELEIHQTQLRLIREQTAAFRSDFTALRKELADTKAIVQRQQASANELDDLFARERQERGKDRDVHHTSLGSRIESIEKSLPKLRDEISGLKTLLRGQDVVMILQAHEDEMKSIKDLHADFRNRHGASDQHHANMQQRVDYLEKMMGDSADKHAAHVKQLEELRRSHDDMRNRHGASDQHHASVQQRVDYLEKMMGDSADKHAAQVKQLEELRRSHDDIRKKHGANDQYHASVQQRVDYLEKMLGDSADKHVAHVKQLEELRRSHDDAHGRHANVAQALKDKHASVEERLKFLEQAIGDSADRHSQELKQTKMQLEALHGKLSDEQGLREGRDKHHATLEERMRYLEQALGDSADKHSRELKAHKDGRDKQHASLEEKVKYIEKLIGDSADEHAKKLEAHKRDLEDHKRNLDDHKMQAQSQKATVERHASFEQRLDFLERALGDSAEHHTGQLRAAKAELEQKQQAHHAATGSLADRLQYLERWFGGLPGFQPPQTGTGGATLRPAWPSRSA